jgi:MFS family permease
MGQGGRGSIAAGLGQGRAAIVFVMLLGLVSLLADVALEGTRSVLGPYLLLLGASAAAVSLVSGLAELIGYGLRAIFGWVVDETRRYWAFLFIGYGINIVAVPALALAGSWEAAMALIMLERVGRAVRGPARDALLSHAGESVGRGWSYGVQEALSSVGGMIGPIIIVLVLVLGGDYRLGFELLLVPCLLVMIILAYALRIEPSTRRMECVRSTAARKSAFPRPFWLFLIAGALIAAGYADFSLISFHGISVARATDTWLPILYAVAMASNALSALVFGRAYDRVGMLPLVAMSVVIPFFVPLVFSADIAALTAGMLLYGIGFGAQESVMRAIVADLAPSCRRGTAFGCYNAAFGTSWFLGSMAMGFLYEVSWSAMAALSMGLQFAAIPLFIMVMRARPVDAREPRGVRAPTVSSLASAPGDLVFVYHPRPVPVGTPLVTEGRTGISNVPQIVGEAPAGVVANEAER